MKIVDCNVSAIEPILPAENYRTVIQAMQQLTDGIEKYGYEYSLACILSHIQTVFRQLPHASDWKVMVRPANAAMYKSKVMLRHVLNHEDREENTDKNYGEILYEIRAACIQMKLEFGLKIQIEAEKIIKAIGTGTENLGTYQLKFKF